MIFHHFRNVIFGAIFIINSLFLSITGNNGDNCLYCSAISVLLEIFLRTVFDLNIKESMSVR